MFEFTQLGVLVLGVGIIYLVTLGRYPTPARIPTGGRMEEEFGMAEYLTDVVVRKGSPLVGSRVDDVAHADGYDIEIYQIVKGRQDDCVRAL